MKNPYAVLLLFVLTAVIAWVLTAAVDAYLFGRADLAWQLLPGTAYEIYTRLIISLSFLVLGFFISRHLAHERKDEQKIEHLNRVLATVRNVELTLARGAMASREDLIHTVCNDLVGGKAYNNVWISLIDASGDLRLSAEAGMGPGLAPVVEAIHAGQYPKCVAQVLSQPDVMVIEGSAHNCPGCPLAPVYRGTGSMVCRLEYGQRNLGVVTASLSPDLAREPQEQALFMEVAASVSTALQNMELEESKRGTQLELARARRREEETGFRIQQMLLFQQPPSQVVGAGMAAITIPSQQVDGDFYDFFVHTERVFDVIIADVMGKGVHAALLGAATKSHFIRAIATLMSASGGAVLPSPEEIVNAVHKEMTPRLIELDSFVTAFYARLDLNEGIMTYVDCGHPKPLHYQPAVGRCKLVEGKNLFLGASASEIYQQSSVKLCQDDVILLYSDGVIELQSRNRDFFGAQRLAEVIQNGSRLGPVPLIDRIVMDLVGFARAEGPTDDLTCVAIKIESIQPIQTLARVELNTSSDPAELARIRGFVLGLLRRLPLTTVDELEVSRLELAVNEAASNIMRHAYHGDFGLPIRLEADVYEKRMTIRLYHWGKPYDASTAALTTPADGRIGGFGLSIIAQCIDRVRYLPGPNGSHCVEMTKIFKKP